MNDTEIKTLLKQYFGYDSLREGQKEVIDIILDGNSAAAIFPTGSGKSLCYQLPALILPHLTLVVSPLLALMKDQVDFLNTHNIAAATIDSTQTSKQSSEVVQGVKSGSIKILMISVERLKNERFREFIKTVPISLMVIDEAHCISEWGHNFRPDYIKLPNYQQQFNIKQVLLLTATATANVIKDMSREFSISANHVISTGFYRQNLNLSILPCSEKEKLNYLVNYLKSHLGEATIIYVTLQKTAQFVSQLLNDNNIHSEAYHAGLKSENREQIQERFMSSQTLCIVATIAFGMGIDKNNIRHVIHYDLPKSIENYAQEIGRAGRDGNHSKCLLLGNLSGLNTLENFVYGDMPELNGIKAVLNDLQNSSTITPGTITPGTITPGTITPSTITPSTITPSTITTGTWEVLSNPLAVLSNIRILPLKTLLVYLEVQNIIQAKYSYYAEYKFKLFITEIELLQKFNGERKAFVKAILSYSQKAKIWTTVDIERIQQNYQTDRQRIITALDYFNEKGWIILESKQMTDVYQVLNKQFDIDELSNKLYQHFKQKEQAQIQRIKDMLALFQTQKCISQQLALYFGDDTVPKNCGHCSVCQGNYQKWPEKEALKPISKIELQNATHSLNSAIIDKFSQAASIDLKCRYLCGITSPWLTSVRARGLGCFGKFEEYGYAQIYLYFEDISKNLNITPI